MKAKNSNNNKYNSEIQNKRIYHDYFVSDTIMAGIVLTSPEVCSIRQGQANISEGWIFIDYNDEVWLTNIHINRPQNITWHDYFEETSNRKLLLNKNEINRLKKFIEQKGNTLIPAKIFRNRGFYKVLIGLCQGKKDYDKRESIKEKDAKRSMERALKNYG